MARHNSLLVFTDLDGTLLDHNDYSWSAAEQALAELKRHRIPLITNTSKTLAESVAVQKRLGIAGPMIFENGAGIALPEGSELVGAADLPLIGDLRLKTFAEPYEAVRHVLRQLREQHAYQFTGFGDMSTAQIQQCTGLNEESAAAAQQRHFGEPIIWQDSPEREAEFLDYVRQAGLNFTRGGRFLHVMGSADKGAAMQWLTAQYPGASTVVALGDGENDVPMLQAADIAVLIRSPAHELPSFACHRQPPTLMIPQGVGPSAWNRAVLHIIKELGYG